MYICTYIYIYIYVYIYIYMYLYSFMYVHTHIYTGDFTHAYVYMHIYIPYVRTYINTACTHIHIYGDAHMRMYVRTYIYTGERTRALDWPLWGTSCSWVIVLLLCVCRIWMCDRFVCVRLYIYVCTCDKQAARESSYCFCACDIFGCVTDLYVWGYIYICVRVTNFCLWNLSHIRSCSWVVALQVCHTSKCVTHININVRMSQVTHTNESCFVYEWVMSNNSVGHSVPDPYSCHNMEGGKWERVREEGIEGGGEGFFCKCVSTTIIRRAIRRVGKKPAKRRTACVSRF